MLLSNRSVLNCTTGITTALLSAVSASAAENNDLFPLNDEAADSAKQHRGELQKSFSESSYVELMDTFVNGKAVSRLVKVKRTETGLFIESASAVRLGLTDIKLGEGYVNLATLEGVTYHVDWFRHSLKLFVRNAANDDNQIDYEIKSFEKNTALSSVTALAINYDVSAQTGPAGSHVSGLISARLSHDETSFSGNWTFGTLGRAQSIRLDTAFRFNIPNKLTTVEIGDFVQSVSPDARSIRMAGLQLASNFDLQPNLVTFPLPDFAGALATPQQIDLLVNDRRFSSETLQAGQFAIRNIPVSNGRGRLGVVVRDVLGRERIESLDFYSSREILRPGLNRWAISIGAVRRRYGVVSSDYGKFATSLVLRTPISRRFTLGVAQEFGAGTFNSGVDFAMIIGSIAQLSGSIRASRSTNDRRQKRGYSATYALQSSGTDFSLKLSGRLSSIDYDDLASANGGKLPSNFIALASDFNLKKFGQISIVLAQERDPVRYIYPSVKLSSTIGAVAYRNSLKGINLFVEGNCKREKNSYSFGGLVGVSLQLGPKTITSASYASAAGNSSQIKATFEHVGIEEGDVGARLHAELGQFNRISAGIFQQAPWARLAAEAEVVNGAAASRFSANGGAVIVGGKIFPVRDTSAGMVLVDTGQVRGIKLLRENRAAAASRNGSKSLITGLTPRTSNKVSIDLTSLPIDARSRSIEETATVPGGSVSLVDFGIEKYVPLLVRLKNVDGTIFTPGTAVKSWPSGNSTYVGLDGYVEINAASTDTEIVVEDKTGWMCRAMLNELQPSQFDYDGRILTCYGRLRTSDLASLTRSN